jgi:hypothetical protein
MVRAFFIVPVNKAFVLTDLCEEKAKLVVLRVVACKVNSDTLEETDAEQVVTQQRG